jgi:hypothetical protein
MAIFFRAAADIARFGTLPAAFFCAPPSSRAFAQRAFCAAAIRARADADTFRVFVSVPYALPKAERAAPIPRSSFVNRSCSFFKNWTIPVSLFIEFHLASDCIKQRRLWPECHFRTLTPVGGITTWTPECNAFRFDRDKLVDKPEVIQKRAPRKCQPGRSRQADLPVPINCAA